MMEIHLSQISHLREFVPYKDQIVHKFLACEGLETLFNICDERFCGEAQWL